jgi:hypothetical protein
MGSHAGIILFKIVTLKIQPAISRQLIINTAESDVITIILKELPGRDNCWFKKGTCSDE